MGKKKRGRQLSAEQEVDRALEEWDSTGAIVEGALDPCPDVPPCHRCFEDDGLEWPDKELLMEQGPRLGHLIQDGDRRRDAIHIAVAPVTAAVRLAPGQHVGLVQEGNVELVGLCDHPIGVVDPFLAAVVEPGERFWLFLYPGTISGLRHVWTHPAFAAAAAAVKEKLR